MDDDCDDGGDMDDDCGDGGDVDDDCGDGGGGNRHKDHDKNSPDQIHD